MDRDNCIMIAREHQRREDEDYWNMTSRSNIKIIFISVFNIKYISKLRICCSNSGRGENTPKSTNDGIRFGQILHLNIYTLYEKHEIYSKAGAIQGRKLQPATQQP